MNLKSHPAVGLWAWWAAGLLICFHGDALLSDSVGTAWQGEMKNEALAAGVWAQGYWRAGRGTRDPCVDLCAVSMFLGRSEVACKRLIDMRRKSSFVRRRLSWTIGGELFELEAFCNGADGVILGG